MEYIKSEKIELKGHPEFDEQWLKKLIIDDTTILGLGKVDVLNSEKIQPKGGRLDLLLEDSSTDPKKRYEVELMLGKTDESHIVRTIEYWDYERNKYPNYEHCAVIVAEEITNRFFNVISLFNKSIPIIAVQLNALQIKDKLVLNFTKVLDETSYGVVYEDDTQVVTYRREDFQKNIPQNILSLADDCFTILNDINPKLQKTYTKNYMGVQNGNRPSNFVVFLPKQNFLKPEVSISNIEDWANKLSELGIEIVNKNHRNSRISFRLTKKEFDVNREVIKKLFKQSHDEWFE
jgi:hypothetical protein